MGHLNVRHYFGKSGEGVAYFGSLLGLSPRELDRRGWLLAPRDQHVRFLRELRPGAPYTASAGVLEVSSEGLKILTLLRHGVDGPPAATLTTDYLLCDRDARTPRPLPDEVRQRALVHRCELPEYAAPRGLEPTAPAPEPTLQEAEVRGLVPAFLGRVRPELCDASGHLAPEGHMAAVSDGVTHFFLHTERPQPPGIGGAALEYRFVYRNPIAAGDFLSVRSGYAEVSEKTMRIAHQLFDAVSGRCVATSEAVVVNFDLEARRAVALTPEQRAQLQAHVIADLRI